MILFYNIIEIFDLTSCHGYLSVGIDLINRLFIGTAFSIVTFSGTPLAAGPNQRSV